MGKCFSRFRIFRKSEDINAKKVTLLILGLDNAGKTTVVRRLVKEPVDDVLTTVGFASYDLYLKGCNISIYDVGGGPKIRDIWQQYYADVHGIIFVVDSSDVMKMDDCRRALHKVLRDERVAGKPVLLLANKQDLEDALDEIDIVERLRLESLVNQQKCPTLVELCAAKAFPRKVDIGIDNGFKWLIRNITKDYPMLNNRVLVDVAGQDEVERRAMEERKKKLEGVRRLLGNGTNGSQNGFHLVDDMGDPFKPISQVMMKPPVATNSNQIDRPNSAKGLVRVATDSHQTDRPNAMDHLPRVVAVGSNDDDSNDDDDDADVATAAFTRASQSQQFFNSADWGSTAGLLDNHRGKSSKTFLQRPKSSGAVLDMQSKKKKKKKKRLRIRNNKTVPSVYTSDTNKTNGLLPAIFDPSYETEVTVLSKQKLVPSSQLKSLSQDEVILNVSQL